MLLREGCQISAFDPAAMERARSELGDSISYAPDAYSTMQDAAALLILTDWNEFRALDLQRVKSLLKYPVVLDGRNLYSAEEMMRAGVNYYSIGRAPVELFDSAPQETNVPLLNWTEARLAQS